MDALVLLIWIAPIAIVVAIARNRGHQRRARSATVELVVDEFGVRRSLADGREEAFEQARRRLPGLHTADLVTVLEHDPEVPLLDELLLDRPSALAEQYRHLAASLTRSVLGLPVPAERHTEA